MSFLNSLFQIYVKFDRQYQQVLALVYCQTIFVKKGLQPID